MKTPQLLKETIDGKTSTTRVMGFMALFTSIWYGYLAITVKSNNEIALYLSALFLVAAFAQKGLTKILENERFSKKENK